MTQTRTLNPLPTSATFSKDPKMWGKDFRPSYIIGADKARVTGNDNRSYLDWVSALGACLLGHSHVEFTNRVASQAYRATGLSLPYKLEHTVACKLVDLLGSRVPGWTPEGLGVRFGLSGTDSTTMAVRLARAVTGRKRVISVGYHGWSDMFISTTPPAWGVVEEQEIVTADFGDVGSLIYAQRWESNTPPLAAVIIEHMMQDPAPDYYDSVRRFCDEEGALLIQDEVVTFPRFSMGGAAELYGVTPDIAVYAKALGNGVPISAMVFRKEYGDWFSRNDPVFCSSTGFGNALSLSACDCVLDLWDENGVRHLWNIGKALMDGLTGAGYSLTGNGARFLVNFASNAERGFFICRMRDAGILANRPWLPNLSHSMSDVTLTVQAAREVKAEIDDIGPDKLAEVMRGKEPMVLFEGR